LGDLLVKKALACRDRVAKIRRALPVRPEQITRFFERAVG
jgi:hypothetical protein